MKSSLLPALVALGCALPCGSVAQDVTPVVQTGHPLFGGMLPDVSLAASDRGGGMLALWSSTGQLTLWGVGARTKLLDSKCPFVPATSLRFGDGFVQSQSPYGTCVWNTVNGARVMATEYAPDSTSAGADRMIQFSPDGKHYAALRTAPDSRFNMLWVGSSDGARPEQYLDVASGAIQPAISFSPDGASIAVVQFDELSVSDVVSGKLRVKQKLAGMMTTIGSSLHFSRDGGYVAVKTSAKGTDQVEAIALAPRVTSIRLAAHPDSGLAVDSRNRLLWRDPAGCMVRAAPPAFQLERLPNVACEERAGFPLVPLRDDIVPSYGQRGVDLVHIETGKIIGKLETRVTGLRLLGTDAQSGELLMSLETLGRADANGIAVWNPRNLRREVHPFPDDYDRTGEAFSAKGGRFLRYRVWSDKPFTPGRLSQEGMENDASFACGPASDNEVLPVIHRDLTHVAMVRPDRIDVCDARGRLLKHLARKPRAGVAPGKPTFAEFMGARQLLVVDDHGGFTGIDLGSGKVVEKQGQPLPGAGSMTIRAFALGRGGRGWMVSNLGVASPKGMAYSGWVQAAATSPDNAWVAAAVPEGLRLYSVAEGRELAKHDDASAWQANKLAFDVPGKRLYVARDDGSIGVYGLPALQPVATLYAAGAEGDLVVLPDGTYRATRAGVRALAGRDKSGFPVPFSEFDLARHRPDLVLSRLGADASAIADAERLVAIRRQRYEGRRVSTPPVVWRELPALYTRQRALKLAAEPATPFTGKLAAAVNNVFVQRVGAGDPVELTLRPGENQVNLWFESADGKRGAARTTTIYADLPETASRTYFLGIGVSAYRETDYNLTYAAKDVRDVAAQWRALARGQFESSLLLDARATREAIVGARSFLARAGVDDMVVIYLAGHGLRGPDDSYYFGTHDTSFAQPAGSALPYSALEDLLNASSARQRFVFMDTCHAGERDAEQPLAAGAQVVVSQTADGRVSARGAQLGKARTGPVAPVQRVPLNEAFVDLRLESGANIIAAAGAAEYAFESPQWNNGVFSYAVLEALRGHAETRETELRISASDLLRAVALRVEKLTNGRQMPESKRENFAFDYPVLAAQPGTRAFQRTNASNVTALASAGPGRVVVVDGQASTVYQLDGKAQSKPIPHEAGDERPFWLIGDASGRYALWAGTKAVKLLDFASGKWSAVAVGSSASRAAFSQDGRQFAITSGGALHLFNLVAPGVAVRSSSSLPPLVDLATDPRGGYRVLTADSQTQRLQIIRVDATLASVGEPITLQSLPAPYQLFSDEEDSYDRIRYDGVQLASSATTLMARVWPVDSTSEERMELPGQKSDRARLLAIWDLETGKLLHTREVRRDRACLTSGGLVALNQRIIDPRQSLDVGWLTGGNYLGSVWGCMLVQSSDGQRLYAPGPDRDIVSWTVPR